MIERVHNDSKKGKYDKGNTQKNKKMQNIKYILGITIAYTLAQGLLLVVSGMWWDDWDYANKNWNYLLEVLSSHHCHCEHMYKRQYGACRMELIAF